MRDRVYAADEVQALLRGLGASKVDVFGDATGAAFRSGETSHAIYIARLL